MKYTKILITCCAVLLMFLFIVVNHNVNMTTSYAVFENVPDEVKNSFWSPDKVLLIGVLIFVTLIILLYVVFKEKGLV
jgi:hypothetical protein